MKTPVANKIRKILLTITTILCWVCVAIIINMYADILRIGNTSAVQGMAILETTIVAIIAAAMTVWTCLVFASNVVIDKDGITQRIGVIKVKHFSWNEVRRVETFEAFSGTVPLWIETYISVLTTSKESWSFKFRRPPLNISTNKISFVYNFEALARIEQYFKDDICR